MKIFGESEKGNFQVVDTMPEKHMYCIGPKHIQYSTGMYLDIPEAEKKGAVCCTCEAAYKRRDTDKIMSFEEHKYGLLVRCLVEPKNETPENAELAAYLKKCEANPKHKKEGYIGFAFLDNFTKK